MNSYTLDQLIEHLRYNNLENISLKVESKVVSPANAVAPVRDVHTYDGQLSFHAVKEYAEQEVIQSIYKLRTAISLVFNNQYVGPAINMIDLILRDGNSYDPSNNINIKQLLCEITQMVFTVDLFLLLIEQLSDTYFFGQCPQGRSTRLVQVYDSIKIFMSYL